MLAKSGKSLARFFPEMVALISRLEPSTFVLDGELIVTGGDNVPSFDALQMRLHPAASRIERLCRELGRSLIMSGEFVAHLQQPMFEIGHFALRGFTQMQLLFGLPEP